VTRGYCAEDVQDEALVCGHCRCNFSPVPSTPELSEQLREMLIEAGSPFNPVRKQQPEDRCAPVAAPHPGGLEKKQQLIPRHRLGFLFVPTPTITIMPARWKSVSGSCGP
jgi:hypothetical protein